MEALGKSSILKYFEQHTLAKRGYLYSFSILISLVK